MSAKGKPERSIQAVRTFSLHAKFTPEGPDAADTLAFSEFWLAALERAGARRKAELAIRKQRFERLIATHRTTRPVLAQVLRDQMSPRTAAQKLKRLVPDEGLQRQLLESWRQAANATPE